ncbi:MAG: glycogen/starch synthase [Ignisphaera sp.]
MYAPISIKKVWMLSFEYSGITKLGGLGEAVALMSTELANRGFEVTVVMPSHGVSPKNFRELDIVCRGDRYGVDGNIYPYDLGFLEGCVDKVKVILIRGRDNRTSSVIDVWPPYSYADEKACLLARGALCLAQALGYPDIVHVNDWHSALAGALLKSVAEVNGYALPTLYQIHLRGSPSYPWHYASEAWLGIPDILQRIWSVHRHEFLSTRYLWDSCWGNIECFMVKIADAIATVSRSEVDSLAHDYGEWIRGKCCYIYNSTSWSIREVEEIAKRVYRSIDRVEIRWKVVEDVINKTHLWGYIDLKDGDILVVSSGRLTSQKGFDTLIHSARHLPHSIKILILGKSVGDYGYENYLRSLLGDVLGKVAIVYDGLDLDMYKVLIYVSHLYVLPSRYEPFGISGIEALSIGTPLVVSNTGGLSEYVGDLRATPLGVGIKVPSGDVYELAKAIQSLGYLMFYSETGRGLEKIVYRELRDIVLREPRYGEKIREFSISYIDSYFRPKHTVNSLISCYELARRMAYYRACT